MRKMYIHYQNSNTRMKCALPKFYYKIIKMYIIMISKMSKTFYTIEHLNVNYTNPFQKTG